MAKRTSKAGSRYGVYVGSSSSPTLAYVSTKKLDANKAASKLKLSGRVGIKIKAVGANPISGKVPAVGWRKEYAKAAYAAVKTPGARRKRAATTGKIRRALNPGKGTGPYKIPRAGGVTLRYKTLTAAAAAARNLSRDGNRVTVWKGSIMVGSSQHGMWDPKTRRRNSAISIVGPSRARRAVGRSVNPSGIIRKGSHPIGYWHYFGGNYKWEITDAPPAAGKVTGTAKSQSATERAVKTAHTRLWKKYPKRANPGRKRNAASILMRRANPPVVSTIVRTKSGKDVPIGSIAEARQAQKELGGRIMKWSAQKQRYVAYRSPKSASKRNPSKASAPRTRYMVQVGETPAWVGKLKSDANKAWRKLNAAGMKGLKIFKVQVNKVVKDGWRKAYKSAGKAVGSSKNPARRKNAPAGSKYIIKRYRKMAPEKFSKTLKGAVAYMNKNSYLGMFDVYKIGPGPIEGLDATSLYGVYDPRVKTWIEKS